MAIQKKIQLYVSDVTGTTKTAKYYRIPLPGDTKPANRTDNLFKDLVRYYAKVSGDKFYIGMVLKPAVDALTYNEDSRPALAANLTPSIPDKLMNDGEGLIKFGTMFEYGGIGYDTSFLTSMYNLDDGGEKNSYGYMHKKKNNVFSVVIESDTENDLSEFVPSAWQEFDSIEGVLEDIRAWGATKPESRGPLYNEHTKDEALMLNMNYMTDNTPTIDIENGTITDEHHVIPDAYEVMPYDGQGTITVTSDAVTADSKLYVLMYKKQAGDVHSQDIKEVTFTGNSAVVHFDGSATSEHYNQAVIQLSHDLIGHVSVTVAKN
jgi:hypothetical protein